MKRFFVHRWKPLACIATPIIIWLAIRACQTTYFVGSTQLELEILLKDADTHQPLSEAALQVLGYPAPENSKQLGRDAYSIRAAADGSVKFQMACGTTGHISGFERSWHVNPPYWSIRGVAPGYFSEDWNSLYNIVEEALPVQSLDGITRVTVVLPLRKKR